MHSQPDLYVILHGPWGLRVASQSAVTSITAATPALLDGAVLHQYLYCDQTMAQKAMLVPGRYRLQLAGTPPTPFTADPQQVFVSQRGAVIADLAYLTLELPHAGCCLGGRACLANGAANAWVGFTGRDASMVNGQHFPHTLVLHYSGAATGAALHFGPKMPWQAPAHSGDLKLHLYAQASHMQPMPSHDPNPSHFACMMRVFGLDIELADAGGAHKVLGPPAGLTDRDLLDLDEQPAAPTQQPPMQAMVQLPFTCGGGMVIYS